MGISHKLTEEMLKARSQREQLGIGKTHEDIPGSRMPQSQQLFDPGLPEDQMDRRALTPGIAEKADFNRFNRIREEGLRHDGAPERAKYFKNQQMNPRPLNIMDRIMTRLYRAREEINRKTNSGEFPEWEGHNEEAYRRSMGDAIPDGAKREHYEGARLDPYRPRQDWSGEKVSPTTRDPRTLKYNP